jgi:hypothetical protein
VLVINGIIQRFFLSLLFFFLLSVVEKTFKQVRRPLNLAFYTIYFVSSNTATSVCQAFLQEELNIQVDVKWYNNLP